MVLTHIGRKDEGTLQLLFSRDGKLTDFLPLGKTSRLRDSFFTMYLLLSNTNPTANQISRNSPKQLLESSHPFSTSTLQGVGQEQW